MTYLDWLKSQVNYFIVDSPHDMLLNRLHDFPFIPVIERDQNRAADGIHLRDEYFKDFGEDGMVIDTRCSFLEFLIALARRMNYIYADIHEDRTKDMFWTLIRNLGLEWLTDEEFLMDGGETAVACAVTRINHREIKPNGFYGLFPLQNPREDQRNVEIWYQMNQYLDEVMRAEGRI